ncbi:MAG: hypothetical protein R3F33_06330 [Planctomycetota bacterium]
MSHALKHPYILPALVLLAGQALLFGCKAPVPAKALAADGWDEKLLQWAQDPELLPVMGRLVAGERRPEERAVAMLCQGDDRATVRADGMRYLIGLGDGQSARWLAQGLQDPSVPVQVASLLAADGVPEWDTGVREALLHLMRTCRMSHVFSYACEALVRRDGMAGAQQVWAVVQERGADWEPDALTALAMYPAEEFRAVFEHGAESGHWDEECMARRALSALDAGRKACAPGDGDCWTTAEFHDRWRDGEDAAGAPVMRTWAQGIDLLLGNQVLVLGEQHAWLPARATQIRLLTEMNARHGSPVHLVLERAVASTKSRCSGRRNNTASRCTSSNRRRRH